ncbi:hypothetical protein [Sporosarcina cascadiensis]|uniref:hypothetical protein n=1 Tax=Sporosarcina cascadiensis TaxID=2660747 RepID=UPI00129A10D3|nr:hypothetical protein [Sporosarcina cascadiensis]
MSNKTLKKMKAHEVEIDESQKQELIHIGKRVLMKNQLNRHSIVDLIYSSIQFTRLHTWLIQLTLLMLTTILITNVMSEESFAFIIQSLTVIVIISVTFFMEEIFRSFTSGMWELEQTLKYELRQHIMIKLLIFGVADLLLIVSISFITQGVLAISLSRILLYLLVPFNISCILLFSVFTVWRNTLSSAILWISSGVVLVSILFITNLFNVYEFNLKYWGMGYVGSLVILLFLVMNNLRVKKWEAFC